MGSRVIVSLYTGTGLLDIFQRVLVPVFFCLQKGKIGLTKPAGWRKMGKDMLKSRLCASHDYSLEFHGRCRRMKFPRMPDC